MTDMHHRRVALIKRPPLVRSSPANCYQNTIKRQQKKSVRFCDALTSVRFFLKTDEPQACQSDPIPITYQFNLLNWPTHISKSPVIRLEKIELVNEQLMGTCAVSNLAFEKHVSLHYTLDNWRTLKKVNAVFKEPIMNSAHTWDRFCFKISLDCHETTRVSLAVKYMVAGRVFWDNNQDKNYLVEIIPKNSLIQAEEEDSSSEEEEEEEEMKPIAFPSFIKPLLSPPLSPTTPVDMNPLWSIRHQHSVKPIHYIHSL